VYSVVGGRLSIPNRSQKIKMEIYTIAVGMEAFWSLLKKMGNIQHQMVMN